MPPGPSLPARIFGLFLFAAGLAAAAVAVPLYRSTHRMLAASVTVPGVVTDLVTSTSARGDPPTYAPAFDYVDQAGRTHHAQSNLYARPAGYSVGDAVQVVYDPAHPDAGRINAFWQLWFAPIMLGLIGPVLAFCGAAMYLGAKNAARTLVPQTPSGAVPPSGFEN